MKTLSVFVFFTEILWLTFFRNNWWSLFDVVKRLRYCVANVWYECFYLKPPNVYNLVCFRMPKKQLKLIKGYCESTLFLETLVWVKAFNWPCSCNFHALLWVKEWKYTIGSDLFTKWQLYFPKLFIHQKIIKIVLIICYLLLNLIKCCKGLVRMFLLIFEVTKPLQPCMF